MELVQRHNIVKHLSDECLVLSNLTPYIRKTLNLTKEPKSQFTAVKSNCFEFKFQYTLPVSAESLAAILQRVKGLNLNERYYKNISFQQPIYLYRNTLSTFRPRGFQARRRDAENAIVHMTVDYDVEKKTRQTPDALIISRLHLQTRFANEAYERKCFYRTVSEWPSNNFLRSDRLTKFERRYTQLVQINRDGFERSIQLQLQGNELIIYSTPIQIKHAMHQPYFISSHEIFFGNFANAIYEYLLDCISCDQRRHNAVDCNGNGDSDANMQELQPPNPLWDLFQFVNDDGNIVVVKNATANIVQVNTAANASAIDTSNTINTILSNTPGTDAINNGKIDHHHNNNNAAADGENDNKSTVGNNDSGSNITILSDITSFFDIVLKYEIVQKYNIRLPIINPTPDIALYAVNCNIRRTMSRVKSRRGQLVLKRCNTNTATKSNLTASNLAAAAAGDTTIIAKITNRRYSKLTDDDDERPRLSSNASSVSSVTSSLSANSLQLQTPPLVISPSHTNYEEPEEFDVDNEDEGYDNAKHNSDIDVDADDDDDDEVRPLQIDI